VAGLHTPFAEPACSQRGQLRRLEHDGIPAASAGATIKPLTHQPATSNTASSDKSINIGQELSSRANQIVIFVADPPSFRHKVDNSATKFDNLQLTAGSEVSVLASGLGSHSPTCNDAEFSSKCRTSFSHLRVGSENCTLNAHIFQTGTQSYRPRRARPVQTSHL